MQNTDNMLNELYKLTQIEKYLPLTEEEKQRYVEIVDFCRDNNIEIDFGINM